MNETTARTSIELCAGAGGQAIGLECAGFEHKALIEIDKWACATLRTNRPRWNVLEIDIHNFSGSEYAGVDLVAGGVPCPPFSVAGKRLGEQDERDLFPAALRIVEEVAPRAVLLENVRGLLDPAFEDYRLQIVGRLTVLGYESAWRLLNASDYGVPQLRPRAILVAVEKHAWKHFSWPEPVGARPPTVGAALRDEMASAGWEGADEWARNASTIAPTLVGGSKKHGGPDLGPTRAKRAWAAIGVNAHQLANEPPDPGWTGMPRLTVEMTAILQGFPADWRIEGKKTSAYRQIGNAFPPPVAEAVGRAIRAALDRADQLARMRRPEGATTNTIAIQLQDAVPVELGS